MRPLQKKGVFPPHKIQIDAVRLSFWKELSVLFYVIAFFVAESLVFSLSSDTLENQLHLTIPQIVANFVKLAAMKTIPIIVLGFITIPF